MGRRVYEVARERGLGTKEVMGRLSDAGVEAKSNLSVVDDPTYQRVFGGAPDGRPGAGEAKVPPRGVRRARRRALLLSRDEPRRRSRVLRARGVGRAPTSPPTVTPTATPTSTLTSTRVGSRRRSRVLRALARAVVVALVLVLSVGVGAAAALVI